MFYHKVRDMHEHKFAGGRVSAHSCGERLAPCEE